MATELSNIVHPAVPRNGDGLSSFANRGIASGTSSGAAPAAAQSATPEPALPIEAGADRLAQALDAIVERARTRGAALDFRVDDDSGRLIVSLVDRRDGTVLRQMPSEEALRIAKALARERPHLIEVRA